MNFEPFYRTTQTGVQPIVVNQTGATSTLLQVVPGFRETANGPTARMII